MKNEKHMERYFKMSFNCTVELCNKELFGRPKIVP